MKVLLINEVCGTGSTGRICTDIAAELEEQGHEVKIAYGRDGNVPNQYKKYAVRVGTDIDVKLHALKTRLLDATGFGSITATKHFIDWMKDYNPDVIHLHNLHGYYINVEILFSYLRHCGKKIFWTLHDCWAYTGHSAYCDVIECTRWKEGCFNCPQMKVYPKSYIDKSKENWTKKKKLFTGIKEMTIVCPSEWLANQVRESFFKDYPIKVIHNGIDAKKFCKLENDFRKMYNLEKYFLILGMATVWSNLKGLHDFIKLAERLDVNSRIVLVGGITDEQKKTLPKNIVYLPNTESIKELSYIYSACDVVFNPMYCDSFGIVNFEDIVCGKPVISYNTEGCTGNIINYDSVVVEQGDIPSVLKQIELVKEKKIAASISNLEMVDREAMLEKQLDEYVGYWKLKNNKGLLGKMVLLSVATVWSDLKGLSDFIKLAVMLPDKVQIILIGKMSVIDEKKLPQNIIHIAKTENKDEIVNYYNASDLYVNLSYCDTYPTVNLEAAACGTPIITYEVGGSTESAKMFGGYCVEKGNINKIVAVIKSMTHKIATPLFDISDLDQRKSILEYVKCYNGL